jgi:hypothetical protein
VGLVKGGAVRLLEEVSTDWWYVQVAESGQRGYVPASYIQIIQ